MNVTLLIAIAAIVIVAAVLIALKTKGAAQKAGEDINVYELHPKLLTDAERSFAGVLEGALPDGVSWFAKVRLGDVFKAKKGLSASVRTRATNRINQKHVDFLLVRSSDLSPIAAIELDDSSHQQERRKQRDAFVDQVFNSCKLPILHVPAKAGYSQAELRQTIASAINGA